MRVYIVPAALATVGLAMVIHASPDSKKDAIDLPAVPRTTVVGDAPHPTLASFVKPASMEAPHPSRHLLAGNAPDGSPKNNKIFDAPYEFYHGELMRLDRCIQSRRQSQSCPFPDNDPKEFEIQAQAAALTTLKSLMEWQKRHHLQDDRITDLMVDYLSFENAYVKQEALKILGTQPVDRAALEPILEDVIEYSQPDSIQAGMDVLSRYQKAQDKKKIDDAFERVLRNGAVNSAVEIAKNLKPFVNAKNWARYDKIRDDMARSPLSEEIYVALSQSLEN